MSARRTAGAWFGHWLCVISAAAWLIGAPAWAWAATAAATVAGAPATERWYVVLMEGSRAGHMVSREEEVEGAGGDGAKDIRTRTYMKIEIKRGPLTLQISTESVWVETKEGEPVSLSSTTRLGAMPTEKTYTFPRADGPGKRAEGAVKVRTKIGSQVTDSDVEMPAGEWKTPAAAARDIERRLAAGEKRITSRTIEDDPTGGGLMVVESTRSVLERTSTEVFGREVPAIKWKVEVDTYPDAAMTEFVDEAGEMVRSEIDFGGIKLVQALADRELALSPVDPPELLNSTLVKPEGQAISNPRRKREGVYVLSIPEGRIDDLPVTPAQRFERLGPGTVRVHVTMKPAEGATERGSPAGDDPVFLRPSAMLKADDPRIVEMMDEALGEEAKEASAARRAERLRRFVHRAIRTKEMSVGFASASEVARTRTGDCSEHGVLLAALLRAAGIPSRVVSGLTYVDEFGGQKGVFGYHMWAQAWLPVGDEKEGEAGGSRWVDLDATLPGATAFDATHITLGLSALGEGQNENFMVALAPLIKRLRITVEGSEK
ncbi:MAG: transglutaminase family protein [Phycisphaerales bacterium]